MQSAQLSADGRWLGWVDLRERLHVQDLKAGTDAEPVQLEGSGYLVDLAQGTGAPLVADDRGLSLLTADGPVSVPGSRDAIESGATRERVAVVGPERDRDLPGRRRPGAEPGHRAGLRQALAVR